MGIGISIDEWQRAGTPEDPRSPIYLREYPLLDREVSRDQCQSIIREAGLPVPPKSSCFFCPFHRDEEWRRMARNEPELFAKAVELERRLYDRGKALGRGSFYFTRHGAFLDELFDGNELVLFPEGPDDGSDLCDVGSCMT